ncbi:hypothetical protein FA13DRAFT_1723881 [Coprinellus micaceus]|uniref:Uncharacterized protein n=1 Tax=Coprinellus micaceus TaxID=71717 RepID=A0A4Y7TZP4_COPMI|nr:hypothetical protein FA13DRAFT_1723881 [Coprinellus micaceus]
MNDTQGKGAEPVSGNRHQSTGLAFKAPGKTAAASFANTRHPPNYGSLYDDSIPSPDRHEYLRAK